MARMGTRADLFERTVGFIAVSNECWTWTGYRDAEGYGTISIDAAPHRAHRVVWELVHGDAPPEGLFVCHRCDNPSCVKPSHLFLGTHQENVDDKVAKGRQAKGPAITSSRTLRSWTNGKAKFSADEVRAIRASYAAGASDRELADHFNASRSVIAGIVSRKTYKDVA